MNKGKIISHRAIVHREIDQNSELVEQFQYELNTIFTDEWFLKKPEAERLAFLFAGIGTEGGEVMDCYKKGQLVRGTMDIPHLAEELGDLMWHISTIATWYGLTMTDVMKMCMEKFRNRWPHRYDFEEDSENEDSNH